MSIFKNFNKVLDKIDSIELDNDEVSIVDKTNKGIEDIIHTLSGRDESKKQRRKMIDNIVLFTNTSGGTGVSTIVSNVAYVLSDKRDFRVCVVDLNILRPIQHLWFKQDEEIKHDLVDYLLGVCELSECIGKKNKVHLLVARDRNLLDKIYCNRNLAIENYTSMLSVLREFYDIVIIDCPMNIESLLENTAIYSADIIYNVWDEGISSIINTDRMLENMTFSGIEAKSKMNVIVNKRTNVHYSDSPIKDIGLRLAGTAPFTTVIIDNQLKGKLYCRDGVHTSDKNSKIFAERMVKLADVIIGNGGYKQEENKEDR